MITLSYVGLTSEVDTKRLWARLADVLKHRRNPKEYLSELSPKQRAARLQELRKEEAELWAVLRPDLYPA